jgi:hypothetical protein
MKLIITIDTEEDNWDKYSATNNPVENIEQIIRLQKLFDEFGVRPTYLVSYPVATNSRSVEILKRILGEGKCEIGMHCHPWNTPPFDESKEILNKDTMLCNLNDDLVFQKLKFLHETLCRSFDVIPISFRAGRWAFSSGVANALCKLGYRIDTSVTPYTDWGSYHGINYSTFGPETFRFNGGGFTHKDINGGLLEVPMTIGFLQKNFKWCMQLMKAGNSPIVQKLRLKGILNLLRLLNKVWLSPEIEDGHTMIKLAKRMQKNNYSCLNMGFHSTSLHFGMSPYVRSSMDEINFLKKIMQFLQFSRKAGFEYCTLAQIENCYDL